MKRLMAVKVSETGLVRDHNEDHVFFYDDTRVCGVADGMGGGEEGEKASEIVSDTLKGAATQFEISEAISNANFRIMDYAWTCGYENMGTTVALMSFASANGSALVCHVGDSRVYRVRGGSILQLTGDHTAAAALGNDVNSVEGRSNPLSHMLTRVIGAMSTVTPEWGAIDVETGDRFLICSDGVHDVVENGELAERLAGGTIKEAALRVAELVVERGAPDNYSMVIVEVQ